METHTDTELKTMTTEERETYFDRQVNWVVAYAYQNSPAMREKLEKAGIEPDQIRGVKDLEKIPITKKEDLIALQKKVPPFGDLLGVAPDDIRSIFISPGPVYDAVGDETYARVARIFRTVGFKKGDIVLNTFAYHLVPAGLMMHEAFSSFGVKVLPTGVGNTELQVQIMHDLNATGYVGTPSFLMTLIKKSEELGYDFKRNFSIKLAFVGAEMFPDSMRHIFEHEYGITCSQTYGIADIGLLGCECVEKSGFHIPEELFIEIVDPVTGKQLEPGQIGEVVVTPFEKTRPVIRYGTGDLSLFTDEPCACGQKSRRLLRIAGRVGDLVKVRGMFIIPKELSDALHQYPQVIAYQAVVNREGHRDDLTLRIELESDSIDREKLSEDILQAVSTACRVKFDKVEWVGKGTIPEDRKIILDERTWE